MGYINAYDTMAGSLLRACRLKAGLTQAQAAKSLGQTRQSISKKELGLTAMTISFYFRSLNIFEAGRCARERKVMTALKNIKQVIQQTEHMIGPVPLRPAARRKRRT